MNRLARNLNWVWIVMSRFVLDYFPGFFTQLEHLSEIYPGHVPDILKTYSKHGQNISHICQNICQKMSRTYPTCLPDISKNVPKIDFGENRFWEKPCFMYGTSGVIHVWYIRCNSSGVIEMPPPASRQARPAIQQRGAHAADRGPGGPGPRCWMLVLLAPH